ncbi:hypothetical protein SEVIR_8G162400v4 [Setaria viridis]|uniref:Uncharacterized protein n=1 Tax=Setaria viridis TaxID=4556 RepID=A0A4U6TKT2_SETVI|nr:chromatin structure-remodeling complex protein SYD-like [Setaria viridis]TKW01179.1 hypothetical protein SEVIR_8G162400v2 [Setaria viridis]
MPPFQRRKAGMLPSSRPSPAATAFAEQQLKQLRAQCLVFLSFRNNMEPKKKHLEIALGQCSAEGSGGGEGDQQEADKDDSRGQTGSSSSSPVSFSAATAGLPPPDLAALSSLRLSSHPGGRTRRVIRRGVGKIQ